MKIDLPTTPYRPPPNTCSNLVVLPFEVVQAKLSAVGAVLVGFAASGETYAPARSNHHPAHLVAEGRPERGVGDASREALCPSPLSPGEPEPLRQVRPRSTDRLLH